MFPPFQPLQLLLVVFAGWVNCRQLDMIVISRSGSDSIHKARTIVLQLNNQALVGAADKRARRARMRGRVLLGCLRFGGRGVGLCERDGGELNIRTSDLCARSHFAPTARYFCYFTDNLRAAIL
jgi:hypothetical protein